MDIEAWKDDNTVGFSVVHITSILMWCGFCNVSIHLVLVLQYTRFDTFG